MSQTIKDLTKVTLKLEKNVMDVYINGVFIKTIDLGETANYIPEAMEAVTEMVTRVHLTNS